MKASNAPSVVAAKLSDGGNKYIIGSEGKIVITII